MRVWVPPPARGYFAGSTRCASTAVVAALLVVLAGCSSDQTSPIPRPDAGDGSGPGGADEALREAYRAAARSYTVAQPEWRPCPLLTDGSGTNAECAEVQLPLSWLEPGGRTIDIFVKRLRPAGDPKQQIWLLPGGPGGGGNGIEGAAAVLSNGLTEAEFFLMDYRGTARSGRLACPDEELADGFFDVPPADPTAYAAAAARCFAAVEGTIPLGDLRLINTTETAMDLGMLAGALATSEASLGILGISFGTYVAERYLHLFPEQPAAVVLDSMVPPSGNSHRDEDVDKVARRLLGHCKASADCGPRLGDDPEAFAAKVLERLRQGHCPGLAAAGIDVHRFLTIAGTAVLDTARRPFLPSLYFRADRCDPADVAALTKFGAPPEHAATSAPTSEPLALLVGRSELLDANRREPAHALIASGDGWGVPWTRAIWDVTPTYPRDAFWGEWARTDAPVFVLASELDANTPAGNGEAARDHIVSSRMEFVSLPGAGHVAFLNFSCGAAMIGRFLLDPTSPVDKSCTSGLQPPGFVVTPEDAAARFGEADLWDNAP